MGWVGSTVRHICVGLGLIDKPDLLVKLVESQPAPVQTIPGIVYVVGGKGFRKWAVFRCPCHENEIVQLSLMPNRRPRWAVVVDFLERPTIDPSVRQLDGSCAHFWVRRGKVQWCADTGQKPTWGLSD